MKSITLVLSFLLALNAFGQQDFDYAQKLINSEQYEEAEKVFEGLIAENPGNGDLYYYYGKALMKDYLSDTLAKSLDDFANRAEELFQQGLQQAPENPLNLVGMGAVTLLKTSDTTSAQSFFDQAAATVPTRQRQIGPEHAILYTEMAEVQLFSDDINYPRAFSYIEKAQAIDNTIPKTALVQGDIYMTQNNASGALQGYNRASYLDPTWPVPKIKIGDIYMRIPNLNQARPYFDEAREIDPEFAPVYRSLGELWYKAGRYDLSNENFERFIDLSGNNTPAKLRYANSMFKAGNYEGALEVYDDILQVDKSRNYIYRVAAYSAYDVDPPQLEKALEYIETFLQNENPDNVIWRDYAYYGRILFRLANYSDSALLARSYTQFMKAYEMDPENLNLVTELALNFYNGRWYEGAAQMYEVKAELREDGLSIQDKNLLGRSYFQDGVAKLDVDIIENAIEVYADIISEQPDNIDAYMFLARAHAQIESITKELGRSEQYFQNVLDRFGSQQDTYKNQIAEAYRYMISLYTQQRSWNTLRTWTGRLKDLDPNNRDWMIIALSAEAVSWTNQESYENARTAYRQLLQINPDNAEEYNAAIENLTKIINYNRNMQ